MHYEFCGVGLRNSPHPSLSPKGRGFKGYVGKDQLLILGGLTSKLIVISSQTT